ncbi:MAG: nitroreductase family protein [Clostridia bacterium]|nr:nitroreductase family protein [Clostridia bacterium]
MDFSEICLMRQSCRKYDTERDIEKEKLDAVLTAARLAPSACNGQPYHITVCKGELAKQVGRATMSMGLNGFADEAPVLLVISDEPYVKSAALGAKISGSDYRSMDIGILAAYITAAATEQGLSSCILGWLNCEKIQKLCSLENEVSLVITLGYAHPEDKLRNKKRKSIEELVSEKE